MQRTRLNYSSQLSWESCTGQLTHVPAINPPPPENPHIDQRQFEPDHDGRNPVEQPLPSPSTYMYAVFISLPF